MATSLPSLLPASMLAESCGVPPELLQHTEQSDACNQQAEAESENGIALECVEQSHHDAGDDHSDQLHPFTVPHQQLLPTCLPLQPATGTTKNEL